MFVLVLRRVVFLVVGLLWFEIVEIEVLVGGEVLVLMMILNEIIEFFDMMFFLFSVVVLVIIEFVMFVFLLMEMFF